MPRHNGALNHQRDLEHRSNVNHALRTSTGTSSTSSAVVYTDPADAQLLRGIPAIGGRGSIGGAITGTRPDTIPFEHLRRKL